MVKALSRGRQVKARALQSSAILVAILVAEPAFAQCTPDPTQANTTTTCTGTDSNGLVVTTSGSTVNVAAGATVTNTGAAAIRYAIPVSSNNYPYATLIVGEASMAVPRRAWNSSARQTATTIPAPI